MIITIIPAKPFAESKKRLSPVLSHQERILLSQNLLRHTILAAIPLGPVVVVSRSADVREFATALGANTLIENHHDLNDAVRQVEKTVEEKMSGLTSGMGLPGGFKLPF